MEKGVIKMLLESIDYKKVFYYFEEISKVPRGSKNNQGISDYLVKFALEHQLQYIQDEYLNVILFKEAAKGYEKCPTVMIQGHMDMVCEKESDCQHDFKTEGLELEIKDDFIYAKGTTLGGDDGIAVAYALAILSDDTLKHPPLEVVITTDEEIGMDGAIGLDTSVLKADYMLNIDSEEEGVLLSSCAGGMTSTCSFSIDDKNEKGFTRIKKEGNKIKLTISGLQGGHSGAEIDKNRTNASILLGRVLNNLKREQISFEIITMYGGAKDNAIPREAVAELVVGETEVLKKKIAEITAVVKQELKTSEPGVAISITEDGKGSFDVLTENLTESILFMLEYAPNGIQTMSSDIEGLVESSLNLGIFKVEEKEVIFSYSVRSSVSSYKQYLGEKLKELVEYLGGTYSTKSEYPAWEYKKQSKLREILCMVFEKQYGYQPKVEAIHAGLECGIIAGKMPNIDIVSFGPNIYDIHTPQERMSISSAIRVYDYIVNVLEAMV